MLHKFIRRAGEEQGFTLIELLVVILIIGILAAIAIPTFLNQTQKANDANAKEMAHTAQTAAATYATDNDGTYTGLTTATLAAEEPSINADTKSDGTVAVTASANQSYTITVTAPGTNDVFSVVNSGGVIKHTCTDGTAGDTSGCNPANGW